MKTRIQKVRYIKASTHHGIGSIPLGALGSVVLIAQNSLTKKALVDFEKYGKAIIPMSCLEMIK